VTCDGESKGGGQRKRDKKKKTVKREKKERERMAPPLGKRKTRKHGSSFYNRGWVRAQGRGEDNEGVIGAARQGRKKKGGTWI